MNALEFYNRLEALGLQPEVLLFALMFCAGVGGGCFMNMYDGWKRKRANQDDK